jgi:hypothetical protein
VKFGEGSWTASADGYRVRLSQPYQRAWLVADQTVGLGWSWSFNRCSSADVGVGSIAIPDPGHSPLRLVTATTPRCQDEGFVLAIAAFYVRQRLDEPVARSLCGNHASSISTTIHGRITDHTFPCVSASGQRLSDDGVDVALNKCDCGRCQIPDQRHGGLLKLRNTIVTDRPFWKNCSSQQAGQERVRAAPPASYGALGQIVETLGG